MPQVFLPQATPPLSALTSTQNAATANACQTNTCNQAASQNTDSPLMKGLFDKFRLGSSPLAHAGDNCSSSESVSSLTTQISYLSQQILAQINQQHQQGGNGSNQDTVCATEEAASETPTANVNNDLSTTVSLSAVDENSAKWQQASANGNYSYSVTRRDNSSDADNNRPINVTVSNGQINSASYADNTPVSSQAIDLIPTIEKMFEIIRAAQNNGQRTDALYNAQSGYPAFVYLGNDRTNSTDDVSYVFNNVNTIA